MILKLILSTLELDLSTYEFSMIEENNWLNDKVSSKYTYPVDIELTPEQIVAMNNITEINLLSYDTVLDGQFYVMGLQHDCVFEIERIIGKRLSGQIRYGLEEFPNFNKQLSELPLEVTPVTGSLFTFAKSVISKTWPEVNYNFPQVITDQFDNTTEQWAAFEGIVNNYVAGNFLTNEFDDVNNVQINRNILQPLPYLLHVLKTGFEDAGHTLEGEILTDPDFIRATIYSLNDFYFRYSAQSQESKVYLNEPFYTPPSLDASIFRKEIVFPEPGRYKVAGNVYLRKMFMVSSSASFKYKGRDVWYGNFKRKPNLDYHEKLATIDFTVDHMGGANNLHFYCESWPEQIINGEQRNDALVMDVTITLLSKYDASGNLVPMLITPNQINLPKCVPNMNFGEFVTNIARWKNYGIVVKNGVVTMDKKEAQLQPDDIIENLTPYEVLEPERNFNQGKTFTLGFFEFDNKEYKFPSIQINRSGYQMSPFVKEKDAEEIVVYGLPLPLKQKGEIMTAHGFLEDDSKVFLVLYDGLNNGVNTADDPSPLSIVNVYLSSHKDWFDFLLNSIRTVWSFATQYEKIYQLKVSDIIYAYRQYHIIRRLTRKNTKLQIIETEIELESLG